MRLFCRGRVVERTDSSSSNGSSGGKTTTTAQFQALIERMQAAGMQLGGPALPTDDLQPAEAAATNTTSVTPDTQDPLVGIRAIIVLDVWKVQTSCGFGVPLMASALAGGGKNKEAVEPQIHEATGINIVSDYQGTGSGKPNKDEEKGLVTQGGKYWEERGTMVNWATKMTEKNALAGYQVKNNTRSLDGLPGLRGARANNKEVLFVGDVTAWARRVGQQWEAIILGMLIAFLSTLVLKQIGISV